MWLDAVDLREFYAAPLGRVAERMIGGAVRAFWPDVKGMDSAVGTRGPKL